MRSRLLRNRAPLMLVVALASCSHESAAPVTPAAVATQLSFSSQPVSTVAGTAISPGVVVVARDASGAVASSFSAQVTLTLASGAAGATLSGTSVATAVAGVATFSSVSINKAGDGYSLAAQSGALTSVASATFSVSAGAVAVLTKSSGDSQSGPISIDLPSRLTVTATDALANPVSGVNVNWSVVSGGGSVGAAASTTNSSGVATITWTLGSSPGAQSASASIAGSSASAVNFSATATPFVFADVSAGGYFTCALTSSGAEYCWGWNADGELGDSTKVFRPAPVAVQASAPFATITSGFYHSCALNPAGVAYCWGDNGQQNSTFQGALGDGTSMQRLSPALVAGGLVFSGLSAGSLHTCGLTVAGVAYCWGANNLGELGDGTTVQVRTTPTPVAGNLVFTSLVAGGSESCGLTAGGAAYCWGVNGFSEVGDGTTTTRIAPTQVAGGLAFTRIAAGGAHVCALTATGTAYCWGDNAFGDVGDATATTRRMPTLVVGGLQFSSLALGNEHSCGLTSPGAAYCWGLNQFGALGDGTTTQRNSPTLVSGGLTFASLTAGSDHTCGRTLSGAVYCWGRNSYYQIGDGTTTMRLVPTQTIPH